ncbi:MAG TPA: hypothetical protein VF656_10785 [Pyrinomonadaceae bacterium]|jgi:hypothetical protein
MEGATPQPQPPPPPPPPRAEQTGTPYQLYQPQYAQPPAPQVVYQQFVPQVENSGLASTARVMGIIALSLMLVGLVPCLGWVNWIMLPFSLLTFILSLIASLSVKNERARGMALMGLVFAAVAGFVGFFRLILGGGCL